MARVEREKGEGVIVCGDALTELKKLPAGSVHYCVTSPPYWGLRDYGVAGQLGLERTPEEYVGKMVEVFREVRRVLRDDGTLWLNLGDSYAMDSKWGGSSGSLNDTSRRGGYDRRRKRSGLKPKDLVGIPWRVAFALQADGWYLRSDIIWAKPNPMPESVTDRPTKAHEYLFLMAKSERYYYDAEAVKEAGSPNVPWSENSNGGKKQDALGHNKGGQLGKPARNRDLRKTGGLTGKGEAHPSGTRSGANLSSAYRGVDWSTEGRNRRSVWTIATRPFSEAHFATFLEALVEPCIKAGCPVGGTVLDPFFGAGTVGIVASRFGREFVGIELNPEYCEMAKQRIYGPLYQEARP